MSVTTKLLVLAVLLGSTGAARASVIDWEHKSITLRVVYVGPGPLEENLAFIYKKTNPDSNGKIVSLAPGRPNRETYTNLPLSLGTIRGWAVNVDLYTVPQAAGSADARARILDGADGVVFVADARRGHARANRAALDELTAVLATPGRAPVQVVFQLAGRATAADLEALETLLAVGDRPVVTANPANGTGVFDTLKGVTKLILVELRTSDGRGAAHPTDTRPLVHTPAR